MTTLETTVETAAPTNLWHQCSWYRIDEVRTISQAPNIPSNQMGVIYENLPRQHPRLASAKEDWWIYYDDTSTFDHEHLEVKALSRQRAFEVVQEQRLNIMKYLGAAVSEKFKLEDVKDFH